LPVSLTHPKMGTGGSYPEDKADGAWCWSLTSISSWE